MRWPVMTVVVIPRKVGVIRWIVWVVRIMDVPITIPERIPPVSVIRMVERVPTVTVIRIIERVPAITEIRIIERVPAVIE